MFVLAAVLSAYSTRSLQALVIEGSKWLFRHFSRDLLLTIMYTPNCVISSIEVNIPQRAQLSLGLKGCEMESPIFFRFFTSFYYSLLIANVFIGS